MLPRRVGTIDPSVLEKVVKSYLELNPSLVRPRQHFTLLKVLSFLRDELGVRDYERAEPKRYLKGYRWERGCLFYVKGNPEKRLPTGRFYEEYRKLLRRLRLDEKTPDGSAYRLHPHVFRKWYRTQLKAAGVNKLLIALWLGHHSGVEKLYYLPTPRTRKGGIREGRRGAKNIWADLHTHADREARSTNRTHQQAKRIHLKNNQSSKLPSALMSQWTPLKIS